jgi:hypothetical protein
LGIAAIAVVAVDQLWLPLIALGIVVVAALVCRFGFRRHKQPTDV